MSRSAEMLHCPRCRSVELASKCFEKTAAYSAAPVLRSSACSTARPQPPAGLLLVPAEGSEQEQVMHCPRCNGLWFDGDALSQAIRNKHGLDDRYCVRVGFSDLANSHLYTCQRCDQPMQQHHLLKNYHVTLDACSSCDGLWVDGDDALQVVAAPKLQRALERLNGAVNVKSWLFQFFTSLPREYNIRPHRTPWVTWSLLALNCLIFVLHGFDPQVTERVFAFWALDSERLAQGQQLWGLVTHQFLHGGWFHLLANMYFLWIIGDNLEDALGHGKFLGLYLLLGVLAALAEQMVAVVFGQPILMVGASGAIAGLFGMYLMWFRHASLTFMFVIWQKKLHPGWYFALWVGLDVVQFMLGGQGIAYFAHFGGFFAGLAVGALLRERILADNPLLCLLQRPQAQILR